MSLVTSDNMEESAPPVYSGILNIRVGEASEACSILNNKEYDTMELMDILQFQKLANVDNRIPWVDQEVDQLRAAWKARQQRIEKSKKNRLPFFTIILLATTMVGSFYAGRYLTLRRL